jgi:rhomboid protease GluP
MTEEQRRRQPTSATFFLCGAIVLGLLIEVATGAWQDPERMIDVGALVPALVNHGQWWRLITSMFLHGNGTIQVTILHITLNLLALVQLGTLFEVMFGARRLIAFYFATGLIGSITSYLSLPPTGYSVGASGSIFGILGAFVVLTLRSPLYRRDRPARDLVSQCVFWILANVMIGLKFPQIIDHAGHMGGLISGLILGALIPHRVPPPPPKEEVVDVLPRDAGSV